MRSISIGVLLGAAVLIPAASAPASTHCSPLHGGFETRIVAYGFNCSVAHKIVNLWHYKAVTKGQGPGNKNVGDFRCRSKGTDAEHVNVVCRHKEFTNQKVTFSAGP
jgi:hypothetical protein